MNRKTVRIARAVRVTRLGFVVKAARVVFGFQKLDTARLLKGDTDGKRD